MSELIKLGTNYGGWFIPKKCNLNENSIIYSGGVGEDMSFDILLNGKYDCNIFLIDPTIKAINHFKEFQDYYTNNIPFKGNIQTDYYNIINPIKPNLNKFFYENIGLWNKEDNLKFYKQNIKSHVSQSVIEDMFGNEYDIIPVNTIKSIMNKYNHNRIDLLKLDIEGAEINVLNNMIDDKIFPKYLCIEFDLKLKNKDYSNQTESLINSLINNGYKILINDNLNITFEHII
jgi:FkbM family methyltransferase